VSSIQTLILCDFAQVRDGLLFVSSGGITRVYRDEFPAPFGCFVAGILQVGPAELDRVIEIRLVVAQTSDATQVAEAVGAFSCGAEDSRLLGETPMLPFVIPLVGLALPAPGQYDIRASANGETGQLITFYVLEPPTQA